MFGRICFAVIVFLLAARSNVLAAPGYLDTSFNSPNGYVTYTSIGYGASSEAVAIQQDGKIITVGSLFDGSQWAIFILRYNENGSLDSSFGNGGVVTYGSGAGNAVAVQPDGKIVVVGESLGRSVILRYKSDGTLDDSFGTGGVSISPQGGADGVALDHDGKIVVVGSSIIDEYFNIGIFAARFNNDGSIDTSFGGNGFIFYDPHLNSENPVISVAIQSDGKILLAGTANNLHSMLILRYNVDGRPDRTFGADGVVTVVLGEVENVASAIAVQDDEKIILAGWTVDNTPSGYNQEAAVLRFNIKGALDSTFGTGGLVITNFRDYPTPRALAVQQDGKIVVTGSKNYYTSTLVMRLNGNGTADASFGQDGYATFLGSKDQSSGWAIALQADGKIVVAGTVQNDLVSSSTVLRLLDDPVSPETIIDNRDANTSQTGTWHLSKGDDPYGPDSLWSRNGSTFTWNFTPVETGAYNVSMWWTAWPSGSTKIPVDKQHAKIPVDIQHQGGTSRVYINQLSNGGKWNLLGNYEFIKGTVYAIKITSPHGPAGTCADAVKIH